MTWLVTGGAGYIGAHVVRALRTAGHRVVVVDDLSAGVAGRVPGDVVLRTGAVTDPDMLTEVLREHAVVGVVHIAARKSVPESVERPLYYYRENVGGMQAVLAAMRAADVDRIVFSSSAAVLGAPRAETVDEDAPTEPLNPYGRTKLICEWLLADAARAWPLRWMSLRYFNVAGAGAPELGDRGVTNLIPAVFRAVAAGERPRVFGGDWPTPDGTCVRDYIHVLDVARAHLLAVQALTDGRVRGRTFNIGRGVGVSVREVIEVVGEVMGRHIDYDVVERRPGDPAAVVGRVDRIATELGWRAELDLPEMIRSAWAARQG